MNKENKIENKKILDNDQFIISKESDWNMMFDELKKQWSKKGQFKKSICLTENDFVQLQYRIGMKLNVMKAVAEDDSMEFENYFTALKFLSLGARILENLVRAKKYFSKTIGTYNQILIVEVSMDEEEYEEYCDLMGVKENFLGRKNI